MANRTTVKRVGVRTRTGKSTTGTTNASCNSKSTGNAALCASGKRAIQQRCGGAFKLAIKRLVTLLAMGTTEERAARLIMGCNANGQIR